MSNHTATLETKQTTSTWYNPKRSTTSRRHQIVIDRVNDLCNKRVDGMRLNYTDVMTRVSEETGYALKTIENIISRSRQVETA